jgi:hypothetical protein
VSAAAQLLAGLAPALAAWLWLRRGARANRFLWLDALPVAAGFLALLALTARPLLAGGILAAVGLFLGVADRAKRATLNEPLVFTDGGLLWQVFAHPRFYLPFVPRPVLAGGIGAGAAALAAALAFEPALAIGAAARGAMLAAAAGCVLVLLRPLALLRGAAVARDPAADAARFGPLATFAIHARLAATERGARRAAHPPEAARLPPGAVPPHHVLLQLESFCDPRRLGLAAALPHWDALAAEALLHGLLHVPGFGANTMRTECAVLTALTDEAMGLDRLNPYFRFARAPVASLAWALRGAGYDTACLHPHDRRFFGRDRVLPALGFRRFLGAEGFADAPRERGLVTDAALGARVVADLAAAQGPAFLYAITVAAHGPWADAADWAARMVATDAMLGAVAAAARGSARPVVIAAFGDHRPALPEARGGTDTDMLVWRSDRAGGGPPCALDAAGLHRALRAAVAG